MREDKQRLDVEQSRDLIRLGISKKLASGCYCPETFDEYNIDEAEPNFLLKDLTNILYSLQGRFIWNRSLDEKFYIVEYSMNNEMLYQFKSEELVDACYKLLRTLLYEKKL